MDATATDVAARGVNDQDVVVGFEWLPNGDSSADLWSPGGGVAHAFTPAPSFCWQDARAEAVNNQGAIAASDVREYGSYCDSMWLLKLATGEEILGPAGGGALPYGINNNNVLVGMAEHDAVRWSPQSGAVVLHDSAEPFEIAYAFAVNDHDEAVGYALTYESENACTTSQDAKLWTADGAEHALPGLPGSVMSSAYDINGRSDIVGGVQLVAPACQEVNLIGSRAVLWRDGRTLDLNSALSKWFSRQYQLTFAAAINDRGDIVARAIRLGEPKAACPIWEWDPETYSDFYDADRLCHVEYAFLLTPTK